MLSHHCLVAPDSRCIQRARATLSSAGSLVGSTSVRSHRGLSCDMPEAVKAAAEAAQELPPFPGEHPARHAAREWMEKFNDKVSTHKLQTAQRGELPLRVQHLRNWPDAMTAVPADVASGMNAAQLYKATGDAAQRLHDNEQNDQRVKIAVLEDQSALFTLLTEPMVTSAPLLRDHLRAKCTVGTTGYFHGQTAYQLVLQHLQEVQDEGADKEYYQSAEEAMRKPANRLPTGCTATQYATRVRNFTHKISPHLQRPYVSEWYRRLYHRPYATCLRRGRRARAS